MVLSTYEVWRPVITRFSLSPNLTPDKIIRLNRLLLEDAYPNEIQRRPKAEDAIAEYQKALALEPNDQAPADCNL